MTNSIINNPSLSQISRNIKRASEGLSITQERLATGKRTSDPSYNPGSAAVGNLLSSNISVLQQASRNANEAVSVSSMMLGYLGVFQDILVRMKTLATESNSDSIGDTGRAMLNQEFTNLKAQIDNIATNANWLGNQLFNTASTLNFQVGASSANTIGISTYNLTSSSLGLGTTSISTKNGVGASAGSYIVTGNSGNVTTQIAGVLVRKDGAFYYSDTQGKNYSVSASGIPSSLGWPGPSLGSSATSYAYNLSGSPVAEQTLSQLDSFVSGTNNFVLNPSSAAPAYPATIVLPGIQVTGGAPQPTLRVNFSSYTGELYYNATVGSGQTAFTGAVIDLGGGTCVTAAGNYVSNNGLVNQTSSPPLTIRGAFIIAPTGHTGSYDDSNGHNGDFNFFIPQSDGSAIAVESGSPPVLIPPRTGTIDVTGDSSASIYTFPPLTGANSPGNSSNKTTGITSGGASSPIATITTQTNTRPASLTFSGVSILSQPVNFATYSGKLYHNVTITPNLSGQSGDSYTGAMIDLGNGRYATAQVSGSTSGIGVIPTGATININQSTPPIDFTGVFIMAPAGHVGSYNDGDTYSGNFNFLILQPNGSSIAVLNGQAPVTIPAQTDTISITADDKALIYNMPTLASGSNTFETAKKINPDDTSGVIGTIATTQTMPQYAAVNSTQSTPITVPGSAHNIDFSVPATLYTNARVTDLSGNPIQTTGPAVVLANGNVISNVDGLHQVVLGAQGTMTVLDAAIQTVTSAISSVGATQSQLRSAIDNLSTEIMSLSSVRSTIEDIDVTEELMNLATFKANLDMAYTMLQEGLEAQKKLVALVCQAAKS